MMGIEPTLAAWEAAVLPLNYTRVAQIVREGRTTGQCAGASAGAVDSAVAGYVVEDRCGGRLPRGGEAWPPRRAGVSGLDAMSGGARTDAMGEFFGRGGRERMSDEASRYGRDVAHVVAVHSGHGPWNRRGSGRTRHPRAVDRWGQISFGTGPAAPAPPSAAGRLAPGAPVEDHAPGAPVRGFLMTPPLQSREGYPWP